MDSIPKKTRIKFYIKDNTYYLYEAFTNNSGNYLYAQKNNAEKQTNILVGNVGEIITEYLNSDFSFMYNIIDEFFANNFTEIDDLFNKLFIKLEKQLNYIFAVLILNKFFDYLDMSGAPGFSSKLLETFNKKLHIISSFINMNEITKTLDFQYLKNIDMDNFEDNEIIPDPSTKFKALIKFIYHEHKLEKLLFKCLINNNINILNLTLSNSITNIEYEILPNLKKDSKSHLLEIYSIDDLTVFLYFEMLQIQKNNMVIRICETCNKFFIPSDNRQIYCSKYCNTKNYDNNLKANPIEELYRRTYKAQNKKKNENKWRKNIEENWETYKSELKKQKERCKNNEISEDEFKEWITRNTNWFISNNYIPK